MKKNNTLLKNISNVLFPVISALILGGILIAAIGENPFLTYSVMIKKSLFSLDGLLKTLHFASPLILTGLAIAITFKANIFNMGVEGQAVLGAFFAGVVGFTVKGLPPVLHITLCVLTGIVVGMLFALVPALLKAYFNVNEMVVTLMLNYVVVEIVKFLSQGVFKDPSSGYVSTYPIAESAMFKKIFDSNLTAFFFIALIVFAIMYVVFNKSKLGYEIKAIGKNPEFSEATGMNVSKKIIIIMLISGAVSGLAGAGFLMSEKYRFTLDFSGSPGLGWDGMLIALLGSHNPIGILVAAVFYAALKTGSDYIGVFTNVPKDIVGVIQGILILLLSVKFFNEKFHLFEKFKFLWKKSSSTDLNK
ncbi:ABC transporter permease [Ruminiclostridium cellulolyticum]|uniref:Inner-membrane translocator n=1 Tax=Ruminiclostridium cellulolyticum (strain ATCC 35319 / DSM 5812 / JCM 6584 / H10) TaxID=394503 RepID=B8HZT6_RUMCH|nr:ABC transporter permease [Ruminiclostridium cellulolyticum]ACL75436.1 inner-membrane translocator [Ruminiclostridium cellulolyticum H10]